MIQPSLSNEGYSRGSVADPGTVAENTLLLQIDFSNPVCNDVFSLQQWRGWIITESTMGREHPPPLRPDGRTREEVPKHIDHTECL